MIIEIDKAKVRIENGKITIEIEDDTKPLSSIKPGNTFKIGDDEFIVLEHSAETTAVIAKKFVKSMQFGNTGDYKKSAVRDYCNGEYYNKLAKAVGENNIVKHTVKLMANDGTGKGKAVKDNVSILTTALYCRYREFLPAYGDWWWTATRVNYNISRYARHVYCVSSDGSLFWNSCGLSNGVRPFCVLKSSIAVVPGGEEDE